MNIIKLTEENLLTEHICCAISSKSTAKGVEAKKEWLSKRFKEGLRFMKFDVKGKVFYRVYPCKECLGSC